MGVKGFQVLPRPLGVVERTFAWFNRYRRLSKDYEYLPDTKETMIYVAMIHLMVRRKTSQELGDRNVNFTVNTAFQTRSKRIPQMYSMSI